MIGRKLDRPVPVELTGFLLGSGRRGKDGGGREEEERRQDGFQTWTHAVISTCASRLVCWMELMSLCEY